MTIDSSTQTKLNPLEIFHHCNNVLNRPVYIAGPMVRYSKLPFRQICRDYHADLVYSPMILAREFVRNSIARATDFSTTEDDTPLVIQVGTNNVTDLLRFVEMVKDHCAAISINCGCPVKEQVREGIGAALMLDSAKVAKLVRAVKLKYGDAVLIETKIRIHDDINKTVQFVHEVQDAGVDWISVHGRTKDTRSSVPVNLEAIKIVKQSIASSENSRKVPVVANGDCFMPLDINRIVKATGVNGVMAVRGVLNNPCLFAPQQYDRCTWGAVEKFLNYAMEYSLPFRIIQHHLSCMLESSLNKEARKQLNECNSMVEMLDWFDEKFELKRIEDDGFGEDKYLDGPFAKLAGEADGDCEDDRKLLAKKMKLQ